MNDILAELHKNLAEDLLSKITSGEATAAELSVARAFLKDNGIDSTMEASEPLHNLAKTLPFNIDTEVA
tara:strand:- start:184 stop:390 length:207 start_codon:yes stop_codon:yes gene_type:complete